MRLRSLILCALFTALMVIGARIPGIQITESLPFTFQVLFVFLAGLMLEPRYALFSQLIYIALGVLLGLPVFSKGGGMAYVLQPSFGFILGFCACAVLISLLVRKNLYMLIFEKKDKFLHVVKIGLFSLASILVMYVIGISFMYFILKFHLNNPEASIITIAASMGVFILIDIAKLAIAIPLAAAVMRRLPASWRASSSKTINSNE